MAEKNKIKQKVFLNEQISIFSYVMPILFIIVMIYYGIILKNLNIFLSLSFICFSVAYIYLKLYQSKIVVTNNKFYHYINNNKKYENHFVNDFEFLNYEQGKIGKLLNFGSLVFINNRKELYVITFVKDVFKTYETIIMAYEDYQVLKNKNYVKKYVKEDAGVDTLDTIEEENKIEK